MFLQRVAAAPAAAWNSRYVVELLKLRPLQEF
jgi:hypothetical protein